MDVIAFVVRTVEIFLVIYLIASFFRDLSCKVPFVMALVFLVIAATLTSFFVPQYLDLAKKMADLTFYSLVVGFWLIIRANWSNILDED